jgi:ferrous iron transport protein A
MRLIRICGVAVKLSDLPKGASARVRSVDDLAPNDAIARRMRDLGFAAGELVRVVALGPFGLDPLLVQVGFTRFALRRAEAARVRVDPEPA